MQFCEKEKPRTKGNNLQLRDLARLRVLKKQLFSTFRGENSVFQAEAFSLVSKKLFVQQSLQLVYNLVQVFKKVVFWSCVNFQGKLHSLRPSVWQTSLKSTGSSFFYCSPQQICPNPIHSSNYIHVLFPRRSWKRSKKRNI